MTAIIDYGVGNLFSLKSSFAAIGEEVTVTSDPEVLMAADRLILPGVGIAGQVANVGDVHHAENVVARPTQEFFQHVLHDIAAEVADVGEVIHGGAAGIHLDLAGLVSGKGINRVGDAVV